MSRGGQGVMSPRIAPIVSEDAAMIPQMVAVSICVVSHVHSGAVSHFSLVLAILVLMRNCRRRCVAVGAAPCLVYSEDCWRFVCLV